MCHEISVMRFELFCGHPLIYICDGGFYSAEDADSFPEEGDQQKKEGAFCVWKDAEIRSILSKKLVSDSSKTLADLFCFHYGVKASGNVSPSQDPHKELVNQNVLIVRGSLSDTASHFSIAPEEASSFLDECRAKLFAERLKRPKPHRDEKILSAWNGLMISGFARAAQALSEASYLQRATDCASFVEEQLYDKHKGVLLRSGYRDSNGLLSVGAIEGFADDYAFVVGGLLDLFEASQDQRWLELACKLQDKQDELFWDEDSGGYFSSTSNDPSILLHMKEDQDGAEPSPNSVSAHNLLRMSCLLNRSHFRDKATSIFKMCKKLMTDHPAALPMMLSAYVLYMQSPMQVVIAGKKDSADTAAMLTAVNSRFIPNKAVIVHEPGSRSFLSDHLEILHSVASREGKATAYLCEDFKCSAPINSLEELEKVIQ